jgi:hypothetical protein
MQIVNRARALEVLGEAMQTQGPDFVYSPDGRLDCYYHKLDGTEIESLEGTEIESLPDYVDPRTITGCLAGVAFGILGIDVPSGSGPSARDVIETAIQRAKWFFTPAAISAFQTAQTDQDAGSTWGAAVDHAEKTTVNLDDVVPEYITEEE